MEDDSVIHGIEGVREVQVQHNREALRSALGIQEALQFAQLPRCATISAKSLLRVLQQPLFFRKTFQPFCNDVKKDYKFGTDTRYRAKLCDL